MRSASERRAATRKVWQRPLAMAFLVLGLAPIACLSDVQIPECLGHGTCNVSGASGSAGSAQAGVAGNADLGGEAGASGAAAGAGGEAGAAAAGAGNGGGAFNGGGFSGDDHGGGGAIEPGGGGGLAEPRGGGDNGRGGATEPGGGGGGGNGGRSAKCDCIILPEVLTPPCAQHSYSKSLTISGGAPPYQWQVSPGWLIAPNPANSSQAKLSSDLVPAGTSNITLTVTDSLARQFSKILSVRARDTCYFAYTAVEGTDSRLELLDPLAESPAPVPLQNNHGVYDFQFSPDGQFLAYRHDADPAHPRGQHITLLTLSSLQEQELSFQESAISAFSWSPDSSLLAVAFVNNDVAYLGGVHTPISNAPPLALVARAAPVQSDLYWIGNKYVAFHAQLIPDSAHPGEFKPDPINKQRTAFFSALGAQGFDAPKGTSEIYPPGIHVQPASDGFFVITEQPPGTGFKQLSAGVAKHVPHPDANLVSPSGRYSASNSEDALLQIFSAEDGTLSPALSTSEEGGCPSLLAWAKGMERIACVADVPNAPPLTSTHGEIRIFDLNPASDTLEMSILSGYCSDDTNSPVSSGTCSPSQSNYSYGVSRADQSARGFSASGRWLAFTTTSDIASENFLYLADLKAGFSLKSKILLPETVWQDPSATPSTDLSFSPDENFLLLRRRNVLFEHDLAAPSSAFKSINPGLAASARCLETFPQQPDQWCGNTDLAAPLRWSANSQAWAFRSAGKLMAVDNTQFPTSDPLPLPGTDCAQQCSGQFAFQPSLAH